MARRMSTYKDIEDFTDFAWDYFEANSLGKKKPLTWKQFCESLKDGENHVKVRR